MEFHRAQTPETRWRLGIVCARLGMLYGLKEFIRRQISYWQHKIWFRYWATDVDYPNHVWKKGHVTYFSRTTWYQRKPIVIEV